MELSIKIVLRIPHGWSDDQVEANVPAGVRVSLDKSLSSDEHGDRYSYILTGRKDLLRDAVLRLGLDWREWKELQ